MTTKESAPEGAAAERERFEAWWQEDASEGEFDIYSKLRDNPAKMHALIAWLARAARTEATKAEPVYQIDCDGSWDDVTEAYYRQHDGSAKRTLYNARETHETWLARQIDRLLADLRWNATSLFDQGARAALKALLEQCPAAQQPASTESAERRFSAQFATEEEMLAVKARQDAELVATREAPADDAVRLDAERYRWFRLNGAMALRDHRKNGLDINDPRWLDEAIDAAIADRQFRRAP